MDENHYREELPKQYTDFTSESGKKLFKESLEAGYMDCYFKLSSQFRTQNELNICGLSTLVMILNTLSVDPGRVWKGQWRWYDEDMIVSGLPVEQLQQKNITMDQLIYLAQWNTLKAMGFRADNNLTMDIFRRAVKHIVRQDDVFMVVSYSRLSRNLTGEGHFSPVGGYHPDKDLVLVLDTARYRYPPHWVPLETIVTAMREPDQETGFPAGGFVLLSKGQPESPPFSIE